MVFVNEEFKSQVVGSSLKHQMEEVASGYMST